jgi:hypothetical protein
MADEAERRVTSLRANCLAADRLREAAALLAQQGDNPFRIAAYRRAADAVTTVDRDLRDIVESGGIEAVDQIPGIGRGIAAALVEMARTGRWTYLERLRGSADPRDVFCSIPGVGPALAARLHDSLGVETLEQLEAALHAPSARIIKGFGARRLAMVRAALSEMLARIPAVRMPTANEPSVEVLLDVDREYRSRADKGDLRKIAPKRFNPIGDAWLPIMHTRRDKWHFTALYSNTARAHELEKVHDWVVLYFHLEGGSEGQRTVVTETRGVLAGCRVVRGRELECRAIYEHPAPPTSGGDYGKLGRSDDGRAYH